MPDVKASAFREEDTLPAIPGLVPVVTLEVRNFVAKGEGDEDENVPNRFVSETVRGRREDWATRTCSNEGFRQCACHTATENKSVHFRQKYVFVNAAHLQRVETA